jgi:hypothetical protein
MNNKNRQTLVPAIAAGSVLDRKKHKHKRRGKKKSTSQNSQTATTILETEAGVKHLINGHNNVTNGYQIFHAPQPHGQNKAIEPPI